jgi:hypothetical protein
MELMPGGCRLVRAGLLLALLATGLPSRGQTSADHNAELKVSSVAGSLRIEVSKTTPLTRVLSAICEHEGMKCAGVQLLSSYPVPPMVVEGPLVQVVGDLLRGTGINFEFVHGIAGIRSDLLLGTAPAGNNLRQTADLPTNERWNDPSGYQDSTQLETGLGTAPLPSLTSDTAGAAQAAGSPQKTGATTSTEEAMRLMFQGGYATEVTPSAYLPFPDGQGRPIPANSAPAAYLPFPDQFGNPIPVKPATPGSPFPLATDGQSHH